MIFSSIFAKQDFNVNASWEALVNGSFIENFNLTYETVMGDYFYMSLIIFLCLAVYMRYQNFGAVAFVGVLATATIWAVPDAAHPYIYALAALGLGLVLYSLYGKSNSPYA